MVQRSQTDSLPKDNPFFNLTPDLRAKAEANLQKQLENSIEHIGYQGEGQARYIISLLNDVQKNLKIWQEYGYEVKLLDETKFATLAEAIGPLKRAGLEDEIRRIMNNLLVECFEPVPEPKRPGIIRSVIARISS